MLVFTAPPSAIDGEQIELLSSNKEPQETQLIPLTTDIVDNESDVDGATLTDALDSLQPAGTTPATAGNPGYASRHVYVNAASTRVGTIFAGVTVEAAPVSWTTAAQIPPGDFLDFVQSGAASGGGSGAACRNGTGTFSVRGGGAGAGAAFNQWSMARADVIAALPIVFDIPVGGAGGAPATSNSVAVVDGNAGSPGATCVVSGTRLRQTAGGATQGGGTTSGGTQTGAGGSGGGLLGDASLTQGPGQPVDRSVQIGSVQFTTYGGCSPNNRTTDGGSGLSSFSCWGGAGGGDIGNATGEAAGGRSQFGGCGGGHGGRTSMSGGTPQGVSSASDGGNHDVSLRGNPGGGGGGASGADGANGAPGTAGADGSLTRCGEGGGGGMACQSADPALTGGAGGEGGFPGGGGGGGGGCHSLIGSGTAASGRGGKGGDAALIVTGR